MIFLVFPYIHRRRAPGLSRYPAFEMRETAPWLSHSGAMRMAERALGAWDGALSL